MADADGGDAGIDEVSSTHSKYDLNSFDTFTNHKSKRSLSYTVHSQNEKKELFTSQNGALRRNRCGRLGTRYVSFIRLAARLM